MVEVAFVSAVFESVAVEEAFVSAILEPVAVEAVVLDPDPQPDRHAIAHMAVSVTKA